MHLDYTDLSVIPEFEFLKQLLKGEDIDDVVIEPGKRERPYILNRNIISAATFLPIPGLRVIGKYPPHHRRCESEHVFSVIKIKRMLLSQQQKYLVHKLRRLKRVIPPLTT